jgi:hypothetical protein
VFDLGDVVPLTVEIRDASGALANAGGTVTLTIGLPDGTSSTPAFTNPSVGRYQCDYSPTMAGRHTVRWVATGTNTSSYSDVFDVRPASPGYIVSLSDVRAFLNKSTVDDETLRGYIEAATVVIENWRNEKIVRSTVVDRISTFRGVNTMTRNTRGYEAGYQAGGAMRQLTLSTGPVLAISSVARADGSYAWDTAALDVDLNAGTITVNYGPLFFGLIVVTYVAGYSIIPANYTLAAKIIIEHLWQLQRQPSITPAGANLFGNDDSSVIIPMGFAVPARAAELLGGRPPVIA